MIRSRVRNLATEMSLDKGQQADRFQEASANRLQYCLVGILILFAASCSDSDDPVISNTQPFGTPEPSSGTVIARLSFPVARDAIDELVSHEYLNLYLDLDDELLTGNLHSGTEPGTLSCPDGGSVSCISNGCIYPLSELSYDNCVIDGHTLTGSVERRGTSFPFASGGSMTIEEAFDNFSIDAGLKGSAVFSGNVERSVVDSQFDTGVTREITITRAVEATISTARLETETGTSNLNGSYRETTIEKTIIDAAQSLTSSTEFSFEGETSIQADQFGETTVNASKTGNRITGSSATISIPAVLTADFGDNSTFTLTTKTNSDNSVQVDIVSGDTSVSFDDTYNFASRLSPLE